MWRDAIRLDPGATTAKLQLARFLNATKPEEADKLIAEALAAEPRAVEVLQAKGEILRSRGDPDGAMRLFGEVLEIDSKNLMARLSRADVAVAQGKFKAADQDLDSILEAMPDNFAANYIRGVERISQQQYDAADAIFDRISPAFSRFWGGYPVQGALKLALGQSAQAEAILRKYLAHAPDDARASRLIAIAALRQNAPSRAIEYLKPLAEKSTAEAKTLTLFGGAYMADSKPELALQQFERAAALDPDNPAVKTGVAVSEINIGQTAAGLEQLEQVFASQSGATIAGPTLVLSDLRAGRTEKAAEVAASLVKREADNPLYQTLLGEVRAAQRDYAGAETAFRTVLAHSPEFAAAARDLAQVYRSTGRMADAEKVYNDLLARNGDNTTALLGLADIYVAEAKWSDALNAINHARSAARNDPTPGLKLVRLYEARRDWSNAEAVAGELSEQFPRDVNVLTAQGRIQLEAGDTNGAIATYKRAYQLAPDSSSIVSRYIALLKQQKYFRDAFDVLQRAVARDPANTSLKADLIRVDAEISGVDRAVLRAEEFARKAPDSGVYDLASAEIYERAGRTADATALLEKAVARRPTDGLAAALAGFYKRSGDFAKAEAVLRGRLNADPKAFVIGTALAPLYMTTGRPEQAARIYRDLLSQNPNDISALIGLADTAAGELKWEEAAGYINRARTAELDDPMPGLKLANMHMARRDWQKALAIATELADSFPSSIDVLDAKARIQIAAGDTDGAASTYKNAYQLAPASFEVFSRYLAALRSARKFDEAQTVLQTALERDPQNASLKRDLIHTKAEIGGLDAGLEAVRSFAKEDPGNSLYEVVSAELYEKAGRAGDGVGLLEKAVASRPADDYLVIALSGLYTRAGDHDKAEAVLKARLKVDPKDYAVQSALASLYMGRKRYAAAVAEYSRLINEHPDDPAVLNNLAWLYQQQGELATAREFAERAMTVSPNTAPIVDTLGWILLGQGQANTALTYLSLANLSDPRSPVLQYHLAVALHRVRFRSVDARVLLERLLGSNTSFADKAEAEKLLQELKRG
jgi:putative PEP-CTERM system TPR-repeat lipoprotein